MLLHVGMKKLVQKEKDTKWLALYKQQLHKICKALSCTFALFIHQNTALRQYVNIYIYRILHHTCITISIFVTHLQYQN